MIARLNVLLPGTFLLYADTKYPVIDEKKGKYKIKIYAPYRSQTLPEDTHFESSTPIPELITRVQRTNPQPISRLYSVDGRNVIQADALQIDFSTQRFDRTFSKNQDSKDPFVDPPTQLINETLNEVINRIRAVNSTFWLQNIKDFKLVGRLQYLKDNGTELKEIKGYCRVRASGPITIKTTILSPNGWRKVKSLDPSYTPFVWEEVLLNALSVIDKPGLALSLGFVCIETLIEQSLAVLIEEKKLDGKLWEWITSRNEKIELQPSVNDQLTILLKAATGKSLEDEPGLYNSFKALARVRNNYFHTGVPYTDRKKTIVASEKDVTALLDQVNLIILWMEKILPSKYTRPRSGEIHTIERIMPI